jgi:uncharacterized membrane protein
MSGVAAGDESSRDPTGDDDEGSSLEAIAAGVVSIITLGVAFGLLALEQSYFWVAFPVGFGGGMPLAVGLVRWYESRMDANESTQQGQTERDAALAELRNRYARGELNDKEFEARVERLLETESVADAKSFTEREIKISDDNSNTSEGEPAVNTAEEDRQV